MRALAHITAVMMTYFDECCKWKLDVCDRCLLAGGRYDLQVVFRLFQLWFTLGTDKAVNRQLAHTFKEVPSHKLLSLVYQIASRMSAAESGQYYESGFQVGSHHTHLAVAAISMALA